MTLEELRKAEEQAYNTWMYYEAAERGFDARAAQRASDDYLLAKGKRLQAEEAMANGGTA